MVVKIKAYLTETNIKKVRQQLIDSLPDDEYRKIKFHKIDDFTDLRAAISHFDEGEYKRAADSLEYFDRDLAKIVRKLK